MVVTSCVTLKLSSRSAASLEIKRGVRFYGHSNEKDPLH